MNNVKYEQPTPVTPSQPSRILVIDDDPLILKLISHYLREAAYQVETVTCGETGLSVIQESPPDLIICDWSMPGISGIDLCQQIKSDPQLPFIYFILLTVRREIFDRVTGLDIGADDFICKPVAPEELRARIRVGLRLRKVTRSLIEANQQLRYQNQLLESLTLTDSLTGVLNRRALDTTLPGLLQQIGARSEGKRYRYLNVWLIDVDHFKKVNDTYGHLIGDEVLRIVAQRLQSHCLPGSSLYRYGGEEFICVTPGINPLQALVYGEQLRLAIELDPICLLAGEKLPITVSLGGVVSNEDEPLNEQALLKSADEALYQAKERGRNQAVLSGLDPYSRMNISPS
jgi:two-component system cell cycle response regulator